MSSSSLRVGFDVTPVISGRTGIARYVTQIGAALERQDTTLKRFAIGRSSFPAPAGTRHVRIPARVLEPWWRAVPWPRVEQLVGKVEIVHATGLLMPPTGRPLVVTVHDVAALRHPDLHPARHVRQQQEQLQRLGRAAVIVSVSATTADDLVQLGIPAERIVVAPLGLTGGADPAMATGLPPPGYLLTVGETSPRKGYPVVVNALAKLRRDLRLVMAGPEAADEELLVALIASLSLHKRVMRLGAVSDETLAGLYAGALALCFPSISEGFGLPVLEAMAAGVPVIAADIPAVREVAADAALYVTARDMPAWAEAIEAVADDPQRREQMAVAGRRRANEFTWERSAEATLGAYRLALELTPRGPDLGS